MTAQSATTQRPIVTLSLHFLGAQVAVTIIAVSFLYVFSDEIIRAGYESLGGVEKLSRFVPSTFFVPVLDASASAKALSRLVVSTLTLISTANLLTGVYYIIGYRKIADFYTILCERTAGLPKGAYVRKRILGFWWICVGCSLSQSLGVTASATMDFNHGTASLNYGGLLANAILAAFLVPSIFHLYAFLHALHHRP
jgi:hypothetical protein